MRQSAKPATVTKLDSVSFDALVAEQDPFGTPSHTFDLSGIQLVTPAALVELAAACYTLGEARHRPLIVVDEPSVRSYLLRAGFVDVVEPVADDPRHGTPPSTSNSIQTGRGRADSVGASQSTLSNGQKTRMGFHRPVDARRADSSKSAVESGNLTAHFADATLDIVEKRFQLAKHGAQLWTRELARKIREELLLLLTQLQPGDTLAIDLDGVEVFDYSFANELFGKTVIELPRLYPGRFLVVENLKTYTRENLAKALEGLGLAMIERKAKKLHLLGKVHPTDAHTFAALVSAREPVTAVRLKDKLGINLTAVNERLAKLSSLGLVRRENGLSPAGREQYIYSVPT